MPPAVYFRYHGKNDVMFNCQNWHQLLRLYLRSPSNLSETFPKLQRQITFVYFGGFGAYHWLVDSYHLRILIFSILDGAGSTRLKICCAVRLIIELRGAALAVGHEGAW